MIEFSVGPLWSRVVIRARYMLTRETLVSVPAAIIACSWAMVASSILAAAVASGIGAGLLTCGWKEGMFARSDVAPAAAATPAVYFRKSLLVIFRGFSSFSVTTVSSKKLFSTSRDARAPIEVGCLLNSLV